MKLEALRSERDLRENGHGSTQSMQRVSSVPNMTAVATNQHNGLGDRAVPIAVPNAVEVGRSFGGAVPSNCAKSREAQAPPVQVAWRTQISNLKDPWQVKDDIWEESFRDLARRRMERRLRTRSPEAHKEEVPYLKVRARAPEGG